MLLTFVCEQKALQKGYVAHIHFFLNFVYTGVNLKVISGDSYAGGLSVYIILKSRKSINIDDTYKAIH